MFIIKVIHCVILIIVAFTIILSTDVATGINKQSGCATHQNKACHTQDDETESVLFDGNTAYFKFNDADVANVILSKRWMYNKTYTKFEQWALYNYTYNWASPLNNALEDVGGDVERLPEPYHKEALELDHSIDKMQVKWNMVTYRYVYVDFLKSIGFTQAMIDQYYKEKQFDPGILQQIQRGAQYEKKGFMSTTVLKNAAMPHRQIELKIRLPRGYKAAYVAPFSAHKWEAELLLPRNMRLAVANTHLEKNNTRLVIDMRCVPSSTTQ